MKTNLTVYAIRNRETGKFLPAAKRSRGYSYDEPSTETLPRIFYTLISAKQTLAAWLRGHHEPLKEYGMEGDFQSYTIGYTIKPVEGRKKEDMEIVEFGLFELRSL